MHMFKKLLAILLACLLALPFGFASAEEAKNPSNKDYEYVLNDDGTVTITKYVGIDDDLFVPEELDGHPVTAIGAYAFFECEGLTSVTLPEGITSIGISAFTWCDALTDIHIPDSVTSIGDAAFSWCESLTGVTIPDGVTSIGESTFLMCYSLTDVSLPGSIASIEKYAFSNCTSLTSIVLPEGLTSIADCVFLDCKSLTHISVPASLTSIGDDAFYIGDSSILIVPNLGDESNLTLTVPQNSYAEAYAMENGIPYTY